MRRALFFLLLFLGLTISLILFILVRPPHSLEQLVQNRLNREISQLLGREVRIGNVTGNWLNHVILKEVAIAAEKKVASGTIFRAQRVVLHLNPWRALSYRDWIQMIGGVEVYQPVLKLSRDKKGDWNLLKLFQPSTQEVKPAPPPDLSPFHITFAVHGGSVDYEDVRGWGPKILARPFVTNAEAIEGTAALRGGKLLFSARSILPRIMASQPLHVNGDMDIKRSRLTLALQAKQLAVAPLSSYLVPFPQVRLSSGMGELDTILRFNGEKRKTPLSLDGKMMIHQGKMRVGGLPLTELQMAVHFRDQQMSVSSVALRAGETRIRGKGDIRSLFDPAHFGLTADLSVEKIAAVTDRSAWRIPKGVGMKGKIALRLSRLTPQLSLKGKLTDTTFHLYGNPIKLDEGEVVLTPTELNWTLPRIAAYEGTFQSRGVWHFEQAGSLEATIHYKDIRLQQLSRDPYLLSGIARGEVALSGTSQHFLFNQTLQLREGKLLGEHVTSVTVQGQISPSEGRTLLKRMALKGGKGYVTASGYLVHRNLDFSLRLLAKNLTLSHPRYLLTGFRLDLNAFEGEVTRDGAKGKIVLGPSYLAGQEITSTQGTFSYREGRMIFPHMKIVTGASTFSLAGEIGKGPTDMQIEGEAIRLEELTGIHQFLPPFLTPLSGTANLSLHIKSRESLPDFSLTSLRRAHLDFQLAMQEGVVGRIGVKEAEVKATLAEGKLILSQFICRTGDSYLQGSGEWGLGERAPLLLTLEGVVDLASLSQYQMEIGRPIPPAEGKADLKMQVSGTLQNPVLHGSFRFSDLAYDHYRVGNAATTFRWRNRTLILEKPLVIEGKDYQYVVGGALSFQSNDVAWRLSIAGSDVPVARFVETGLAGYRMWQTLVIPQVTTAWYQPQLIDVSKVHYSSGLPRREQAVLYRDPDRGALPEGFLIEWRHLVANLASGEFHPEIGQTIPWYLSPSAYQGKMTLKGNLKGTAHDFQGLVSLQIRDGGVRGILYDALSLDMTLRPSQLLWDARLEKAGGVMIVENAKVGLTGLSAHVSAIDMPLEVLKPLVPGADQFSVGGTFRMNADLRGPFHRPVASVSLTIRDGRWEDLNFDQIISTFRLTESQLAIQELSITQGKETGHISGSIPLHLDGKLALSLALQDENLKLLAPFRQWVEWHGGKGKVGLTLGGTLRNPIVTGEVDVNEAKLILPKNNLTIDRLKAVMKFQGKEVVIQELSGLFQGQMTGGKANQFVLGGKVGFSDIVTPPYMLALDLNLSNTTLYVEVPKLYRGEVELKNVSLAGPFLLQREAGGARHPTLYGEVVLRKAQLQMASGGESDTPAPFPLGLNLVVSFEEECKLVTGERNLLQIDVNQMLLNMDVFLTGKAIKVQGSLDEPVLIGIVHIPKGTVNLLNRPFAIMTEKAQLEYVGSEALVSSNEVTFKGRAGETRAGVYPDVQLTAAITVRDTLQLVSQDKKRLTIVSHIKGRPFAEQQNALSVTFTTYDHETKKEVAISQDDVRVLLLPEFLQKNLGLVKETGEEGGTSPQVARTFARDYFKSNLQNYLDVVVSQEVEESLGLELFTLEYNFGRDVGQLLGTTATEDELEEPTWRVTLEKRVFRRLTLGVQYYALEQGSEAASTLGGASSFRYDLTYSLTDFLDLGYRQTLVRDKDNQLLTASAWRVNWDLYEWPRGVVSLSYLHEPPSYADARINNKIQLGMVTRF